MSLINEQEQQLLTEAIQRVEGQTDAELVTVLARQAAEQFLGTETLLYARVDMLRDAEGQFRLMELELIEPSLFFEHAADGGALFVGAIEALSYRE